MKHKITTRERYGSIQAIVAYKYDDEAKWRTKSKQGFTKKSDAQRWASRTVVELADQEHRRTGDDGMTLGDAAEMFLLSKAGLTANTQKAYRSALKQIAPFYSVKLNKLNAQKTQEIARGVSPGTAQSVRSLWAYMLKMDLIRKSYLDLKAPAPKPRNRIVDYATYINIINSDIPLQARVFCIVAYHTGMRAGEVLGLTPDHVKRNSIVVDRQWTMIGPNIYGFSELKNKEKGKREIPIPPEVYEALNELPFNFAQGRYFSYNLATYINKELRKINCPHSAHHFRHTRASELVHAGFNLRYIALILGDTLDTVIKTYVSLSDQMKREEDKKFLSYFCREK